VSESASVERGETTFESFTPSRAMKRTNRANGIFRINKSVVF
jgi:hypothetical protein